MNLINFKDYNEIKESLKLAKEKFSLGKDMFFLNKVAVEETTPEIVAFYRAKRMSNLITGKTVLDLCCGSGMDSIGLAKYAKKVIAIDNNYETIECAKQNAKLCGITNIEFICIDYKKFDFTKEKIDFVFSDPERRKENKRLKLLNETNPSTIELINFLNKNQINDFVIEISNNFTLDELNKELDVIDTELKSNCEKEFCLFNKNPNCINLYFGKFKETETSLVNINMELFDDKTIVEDRLILTNSPINQLNDFKEINVLITTQSHQKYYLYELIKGIDGMNLINDLINLIKQKNNLLLKENIDLCEEKNHNGPLNIYTIYNKDENKQSNLIIDKLIESNFFKNRFEVLFFDKKVCENKEFLKNSTVLSRLIEKLNQFNVSKIVLRGKFEEKIQIELKSKINSNLINKNGIKAHIFFFEKNLIIAKNIDFDA
ncbi:MAG: methyltransferase domain-containing protein [Candidatus ainarchaeum sp.]|nr:methyltransferase domain-containing protein [Candidatus ainarchaeum sp.]